MNSLPAIRRQPRARILIVDEIQSVGSMMAEALVHHGYAVDQSGSAREALLLAQTGRWDAVVIDAGLPAMKGVELYTRLHRDSGRECLPVIFVSGHLKESLLRVLQSVPRASLLEMPFSVFKFLSTLEQCLQSGLETK